MMATDPVNKQGPRTIVEEIPGTEHESLGKPKSDLTMDDLIDAMRYVFRLEGGRASHKIDGVFSVPRGRIIAVLPTGFREIDEEYQSVDVAVSNPKIKGRVLTLRKDTRFMFLPPELAIDGAYAYLRDVLLESKKT